MSDPATIQSEPPALASVIDLTARCRAAYKSGDLDECFRIMMERDAAYAKLHPFDALTYIEWARGRIPDPFVVPNIASCADAVDPTIEEHW